VDHYVHCDPDIVINDCHGFEFSEDKANDILRPIVMVPGTRAQLSLTTMDLMAVRPYVIFQRVTVGSLVQDSREVNMSSKDVRYNPNLVTFRVSSGRVFGRIPAVLDLPKEAGEIPVGHDEIETEDNDSGEPRTDASEKGELEVL
jgi:hypothetical protein